MTETESSLFIDESYSLARLNTSQSFYILAGIKIANNRLEELNCSIQRIVSDGYWHSSEQIRTASGRKLFSEFCEEISGVIDVIHFVISPLDFADKLGESARIRNIESLVGSTSFRDRIIFEKRRPGFEQSADLRTVAKIRSQCPERRHQIIKFESPSDCPELLAADVVCTAIRYTVMGRTKDFVEILNLNEQTLTAFR